MPQNWVQLVVFVLLSYMSCSQRLLRHSIHFLHCWKATGASHAAAAARAEGTSFLLNSAFLFGIWEATGAQKAAQHLLCGPAQWEKNTNPLLLLQILRYLRLFLFQLGAFNQPAPSWCPRTDAQFVKWRNQWTPFGLFFALFLRKNSGKLA